MNDLSYNVDLMDITIQNGDFVLNNSISEQNVGLFLGTKNCNLYFPLCGVALPSLINPNTKDIQNTLSLWQKQVSQDGAKTANYTLTTDKNGGAVINANCAY